MNALSRFGRLAILISFAFDANACKASCDTCAQLTCAADDEPQSWIFRRSTYTHDPYTGARVAQYQRLPAIEPLEDERLVTSRYHRVQTNLRGTAGSSESMPSGNDSTTRGKNRTCRAAFTIRVPASATVIRTSLETAASAGPVSDSDTPDTDFQETVSRELETGGRIGETRARAGMAMATDTTAVGTTTDTTTTTATRAIGIDR
jgi:hypothetical protein